MSDGFGRFIISLIKFQRQLCINKRHMIDFTLFINFLIKGK